MSNFNQSPNIYSILGPIMILSNLFFMPSFCKENINNILLVFNITCSIGVCIIAVSVSISQLEMMLKSVNICNFSHAFWVFVLTAGSLTTYTAHFLSFKDMCKQISKLNIILKNTKYILWKKLIVLCPLHLFVNIGIYIIISIMEFATLNHHYPVIWTYVCFYLDMGCNITEIQYVHSS